MESWYSSINISSKLSASSSAVLVYSIIPALFFTRISSARCSISLKSIIPRSFFCSDILCAKSLASFTIIAIIGALAFTSSINVSISAVNTPLIRELIYFLKLFLSFLTYSFKSSLASGIFLLLNLSNTVFLILTERSSKSGASSILLIFI